MNKYSQFFFLFLLIISCDSKQENQINKYSAIVNIIDFEEKKSYTIQEPNYIAIFDEETAKNSNLANAETEIVNNNLANAVEKYNDELKTKL